MENTGRQEGQAGRMERFFFDPIFFLLIRKSIGSFDINMIPYKYYA
jgi:hypothetical protein